MIVRHPSLKNGKLFRETYVDHDKVEESGSEYWAKLLRNSIKSNFGYTDLKYDKYLQVQLLMVNISNVIWIGIFLMN